MDVARRSVDTGHTRLSIIGLNNGSQPMSSPDGVVHMVANGELYGYREIRERLRADGYRFSTDSDSEVALHLYHERGTQAASLLQGEFAIVIADERQRSMIAIRDRFRDQTRSTTPPSTAMSSSPRRSRRCWLSGCRPCGIWRCHRRFRKAA